MQKHLLTATLLIALSGCADDEVDVDGDIAVDIETSDTGLSTATDADASDADMPTVDVVRTRGAGTVIGSDAELRFLTLDHDPLPAIQMDAMTMPFDIADSVELDGIQEGDRVTFDLEASVEEGLLITKLCRPSTDGEDCLD